MHKVCLQMCLRLVRIGYQCLFIIFFDLIITTNTQLIVLIILIVKSRDKMKRGRENLFKTKGGHEQKSLGSRDVNDIPNSVSCNPRLFAVDTCFLVSSPSLTVLENDSNKKINKLQIWFSANELQINPEKFAIL